MENINDIIKSDLLKRYVSGDVNLDEKMKVEMLIIDQPAIRRAIREIEITIEAEALINQVEPPQHLKATILKQLNPSSEPLATPKGIYSSPWKSYLAYAATLLLGGILTWAVMNQKINQATEKLESTEQELNVLLQDCTELSDMYAFINDGATTPFILDGDAFQKEANVIVYWNQERRKAMIRVVNLPSIQANQTYQLWADVDGEMLDLGTFDAGLAIVDPIAVKYLDEATSLNITIEPIGGSSHPTVETLTANRAI